MKTRTCVLIALISLLICASPLLMFVTRLFSEDRNTLAITILSVFLVFTFVILYAIMVTPLGSEPVETEPRRPVTNLDDILYAGSDGGLHATTVSCHCHRCRQIINDRSRPSDAPPEYDAVMTKPPAYDQLQHFTFQPSITKLSQSFHGNKSEESILPPSSPSSSLSLSSYSSASSTIEDFSSYMDRGYFRMPSVRASNDEYPILQTYFVPFVPTHQQPINNRSSQNNVHLEVMRNNANCISNYHNR